MANNNYNNYGTGYDDDKTIYGGFERQPQFSQPQQSSYSQQSQQPYGQSQSHPYVQQQKHSYVQQYPQQQAQPHQGIVKQNNRHWIALFAGLIVFIIVAAIVVAVVYNYSDKETPYLDDLSLSELNGPSNSTLENDEYTDGYIIFKCPRDAEITEMGNENTAFKFEHETDNDLISYIISGEDILSSYSEKDFLSTAERIRKKFGEKIPDWSFRIVETTNELKGEKRYYRQTILYQKGKGKIHMIISSVRSYKKNRLGTVAVVYTDGLSCDQEYVVNSIRFND